MSELTVLALLGIALFVGSFVQSSIGFGINVVSGPVVLLVAPDLMPGALILCGQILPAIQVLRDGLDVNWRPLGWSLAARAATTPLGVWLVLVLDKRWLGFILGVLILITVALSVRSLDIRPTTPSAVIAGALSGVTGASAAVGGPFAALLFQHEPARRLRSTLAVSFLVGGTMSIIGLLPAGHLGSRDVLATAVWAPFVIAGYAAAGPAKRYLDGASMHSWVLGFCAVSAVVIIARVFM